MDSGFVQPLESWENWDAHLQAGFGMFGENGIFCHSLEKVSKSVKEGLEGKPMGGQTMKRKYKIVFCFKHEWSD